MPCSPISPIDGLRVWRAASIGSRAEGGEAEARLLIQAQGNEIVVRRDQPDPLHPIRLQFRDGGVQEGPADPAPSLTSSDYQAGHFGDRSISRLALPAGKSQHPTLPLGDNARVAECVDQLAATRLQPPTELRVDHCRRPVDVARGFVPANCQAGKCQSPIQYPTTRITNVAMPRLSQNMIETKVDVGRISGFLSAGRRSPLSARPQRGELSCSR